MSLERLRSARKRIVGTRQTLKALEKNMVKVVYIARDAEEHVTRDVINLCEKNNVEAVYVDSMKMLGRACGIEVGAATAAIIED